MAHVSLRREALPVPAPLFQQAADLGVDVSIHGGIIAKFCALRKQHIAPSGLQSSAMAQKSLNQVLADNLNRVIEDRELSNKQLGKMAGVAPNTIANYRNATPDTITPSGKERSAKLAEVELGQLGLQMMRAAQPRPAAPVAPTECRSYNRGGYVQTVCD